MKQINKQGEEGTHISSGRSSSCEGAIHKSRQLNIFEYVISHFTSQMLEAKLREEETPDAIFKPTPNKH